MEVEDESQILSTDFLYLSVWEIGSDKAWDYSEIRMFSTVPGFEKDELVLKKTKIFFEHALCLSAAYAIKFDLSKIYYGKDQSYGWI